LLYRFFFIDLSFLLERSYDFRWYDFKASGQTDAEEARARVLKAVRARRENVESSVLIIVYSNPEEM
jgi:hypothetical protein